MTAVAPCRVVSRPYPVQKSSLGAQLRGYLHTTDPNFGFAHFVLPLQIGSPDAAFPKRTPHAAGSR